MPYSHDDLTAALDLVREQRPNLIKRGLSSRFLGNYIKYELRYIDPLKCPSTWVDDDPSGDFELYDDRQNKKPQRPQKRKAIGPPLGTSEPATIKTKTSNEPIPNPLPLIEDSSVINLKFKLPASKCFLAVLEKQESKSMSSTANIDIGISKKVSHKSLSDTTFLSTSAGTSSVADSNLVVATNAGQHSHETLIENEPGSLEEPSVSQEVSTFVTIQGQEVQFRNQASGAAPFSKIQDAILQSNVRSSLEPPAEKQGSWEDHTPFPPPENSEISQMTSPSVEQMILQELSQKPSAETHSPSLLAPEAGSAASTTSANIPPTSPPQIPSDYTTIIPNIISVKARKRRTAGPQTKKIRTSFAHPIDFAYSPPSNGSRPCHWCHDFIYGMLGLGKIEVEVLNRRDGKGYIELSTGHVSSGYEPSRMCSKCALHRVAILECSTTTPLATHSVVPIAGIDEGTLDIAAAFGSLFAADDGDGCGPDRPPSQSAPANPWCSICINPAFYKCAGKPAKGSVIETLGQMGVGSNLGVGEGVGVMGGDMLPCSCGLLLCGRCATLMRQFKGRLGRTVEKRKGEGVELRADIEFLNMSSELYQTYERKVVGFW
ncbi:hypothetical protein AJ78_01632 [Emergomyces pasteurianus Ep9510]|uniref:Uncharacterized protein n=1 Tax=Emergomyces pasteurianus Ep9510 TaxID=1447872 RepID=A0A1J9QQ57_9EURO|nr:hypothetical protein AJ78_01632 [Emergomyces pasteurianus Ep9510]